MVSDMVWAFTRRDSLYPDRLIYEAFASDLLDGPRHTARCRQPGPVGHTYLPLKLRHRMMATAIMFFGAPETRLALYGVPQTQQADLAGLVRRLDAADRAEFAERRARWARAGSESAAAPCHSPVYGTDITQREQYPV